MTSHPTPPCRLIELALEPRSPADQEALLTALEEMLAKDPSFDASIDAESGQTILRGDGELQLDRLIDVLKVTRGIGINIGAPQVAYRETLGRRTEIDYTHKKQTGGSGQFARIKLVFEPGEPGSGYKFESKVVGGNVPKEYIPGVEKGLESAKENGLLAGFPVDRLHRLAGGRQLPRRGLQRAGVRDRGARRIPRAARPGPSQAARADHEGRGGDAG